MNKNIRYVNNKPKLKLEKKDWKWVTQQPIALEDVPLYGYLEELPIKNWRDFPHQRWDWIQTDDNWVCCVTKVFDDSSVSLCGRWIITPKKAKKKFAVFRIFNFYSDRLRFNNRLKIMVNSAILTGDWFKSYELAYNKPAKKVTDIIGKMKSGGEDYLLKNLDELLDNHGISDSYVIERMKDLCDGMTSIVTGDGVIKRLPDNRIKDTTMKEMVILFARMKSIAPEEQPKLPSITDNRKVEVHNHEYKEVMKQLKEGSDGEES